MAGEGVLREAIGGVGRRRLRHEAERGATAALDGLGLGAGSTAFGQTHLGPIWSDQSPTDLGLPHEPPGSYQQ